MFLIHPRKYLVQALLPLQHCRWQLLAWPDFSKSHLSLFYSHVTLVTPFSNYMKAGTLETKWTKCKHQERREVEMEIGDLREIQYKQMKCRVFSPSVSNKWINFWTHFPSGEKHMHLGPSSSYVHKSPRKPNSNLKWIHVTSNNRTQFKRVHQREDSLLPLVKLWKTEQMHVNDLICIFTKSNVRPLRVTFYS